MPREVLSTSIVLSHKSFQLDPTRPIYKFINVHEEKLKTVKIGTNTELAIEETRKKLENLTIALEEKQKQEDLPKINTLE